MTPELTLKATSGPNKTFVTSQEQTAYETMMPIWNLE